MEAIILAGGLGTRLRQKVPDLPKPMAPIAGRPFLEILLDLLALKGFTHIVLSVGYKADKINPSKRKLPIKLFSTLTCGT